MERWGVPPCLPTQGWESPLLKNEAGRITAHVLPGGAGPDPFRGAGYLRRTGSRGVTGVLVPATDFHLHGAVGLHDPDHLRPAGSTLIYGLGALLGWITMWSLRFGRGRVGRALSGAVERVPCMVGPRPGASRDCSPLWFVSFMAIALKSSISAISPFMSASISSVFFSSAAIQSSPASRSLK